MTSKTTTSSWYSLLTSIATLFLTVMLLIRLFWYYLYKGFFSMRPSNWCDCLAFFITKEIITHYGIKNVLPDTSIERLTVFSIKFNQTLLMHIWIYTERNFGMALLKLLLDNFFSIPTERSRLSWRLQLLNMPRIAKKVCFIFLLLKSVKCLQLLYITWNAIWKFCTR